MNERHTDAPRPWHSTAVGRTRDAGRCVSELLMGLGIAPHLKGYAALRDGVRMLAETSRTRRIRTNEDLYPLLGEKGSQIEHAVRDAIRTAWERNAETAAQTDLFFGIEQPTNAVFLYTLAERVRDRMNAEWEA